MAGRRLESTAGGEEVLAGQALATIIHALPAPRIPSRQGDVRLPVWVERGALKLPASPETPLLLVGPGTGVAPLRSFLQHRRAALLAGVLGEGGPWCLHGASRPACRYVHHGAIVTRPPSLHVCVPLCLPACLSTIPGAPRSSSTLPAAGAVPRPAPCTLFFGCRHEAGDFCFRQEWGEMQAQGVLAPPPMGIVTAFSRDAADGSKVYVQQRIRELGASVWAALAAGAAVFVAGSADKMPAAVAAAFEDVVASHGGLASAEAAAFVRRLEVTGRYQVEAWS